MNFAATFGASKPVIGMVHLPGLPGAPAATAGMETVIERAREDARALEAGGLDGESDPDFGAGRLNAPMSLEEVKE